MGRIALLAPWLQRIFPPAETPGLQPLETGNDISYVHDVFSGNDDLVSEVEASLGAAGVITIQIVGPRDQHYVVVHALQYSHNDPVARSGIFRLEHDLGDTSLENGIAVSTAANVVRGYGRTLILPPFFGVGVTVPSLAAAQVIVGQASFTRVPIGHPHQHF